MKKIFSILVALLLAANVFAQVPEKMSYQAVIRDASDKLVTNQQIGMQISILQNTIPVYIETQTPTTNANGLVSFEIGGGNATVVSGDFSTIDWANSTYFIKTETDPTGGTSYTIAGTSQLLSIPYALYTKKAETATEADPVYSASESVNITATDITNLGNLSGVNSGDQDLSTLASKTALGDSTAQVRSEIPMVISYSVGDFAQGGIVFLVDETGQHGLVCAKEDQSTGVRWYAGTFGDTRAYGDHINAGKMNTDVIIGSSRTIGDDGSPYASEICKDLTLDGYSDWYLPSKEELNLMYHNKATIDEIANANGGGSFASFLYWSSTEISDHNAWLQNFNIGTQHFTGKNVTYYVRAVRAF